MRSNVSVMENLLVCDFNCNIHESTMLKFSYKEWQIMLGLYSMLLTLHMRFTNSIEQDE
jgi:hypothetical protein